MLADIADLKAALGIDPAEVNTVRDAQLNSALATANALIAGYIGYDVSDTETERVFTTVIDGGAAYFNLPLFPIVEVVSITGDNVPLALADYTVRPRTGAIDFGNGVGGCAYGSGGRYGRRMTVVYRAGYEDLPPELKTVALNIASSVYNMGGSFAASTSGTGALKSLTMFDAMSMSFDTGAASASDASTPEGLIGAWAFMLNTYRVKTPVMA
jgi:hypothetical protein